MKHKYSLVILFFSIYSTVGALELPSAEPQLVEPPTVQPQSTTTPVATTSPAPTTAPTSALPQIPVESQKQQAEEKEFAQEAEKQEAVEKIGIDTVDIEEGGNWLLKRKALEDTVDIIEQINRLFTKILESRMDYQIKRNQLDSEYDLFVATIGFDLGDIDELLESLTGQLEKERKREGDLSPNERTLLEEIQEKKNEINRLQQELKLLHDAENNLNEVLLTVENQINTANEHQNQAWKNFQLIKKILSDEKAEELYYNTEGMYKSLQEIFIYLTNRLPQFFNDQLQAVRDQMNKIKATVNSLKEKGVDLKKEAEKIESAELELEKKRSAAQEKTDVEMAVKKIETERQAKNWWHTIWTSITSFFTAVGSYINYLISSIKGLFVKETVTPPAATVPPAKVTPAGT